MIEEFLKKRKIEENKENKEVLNIIFKILMKHILIKNLSYKEMKSIKEPDNNETKNIIEY